MKYRDINITPTQREPDNDRQVPNSAGGYVYEVSPKDRLRRFLVLGSEGGTFYASQRDLTKSNVDFMKSYAATSPEDFLDVLMDVDDNNVAPRHSTVLLALAVLYTHCPAHGQIGTHTHPVRTKIEQHFTGFVRTGTHLFEFVDYVTMYRKWGRSLRRLVGSWYKTQDGSRLAYQVVKYRQRGGWTHRDLLRLAHPVSEEPLTKVVLDYVTHGPITIEDATKAGKPTTVNVDVHDVIDQFEAVKNGDLSPIDAGALTWEMLPTDSLRDPKVWQALILQGRLPYTAMVRNLGRMTSIGVFDDRLAMKAAVSALTDQEYVRKSRVHPFNVLNALRTYSGGGGFRGSLTWTPKQSIVDALDKAFYLAFGNVPETGKRINIALDVSGSMGSKLMNTNISAREASAAMALALIAGDQDTTDTVAFTSGTGSWSVPGMRQRFTGYPSGITELGLSPRRRMDDVIREVSKLRMGGTDCALPILWAVNQKKVYDAFIVMTDNETWAGSVHPMEALRAYRRDFNPQARLIVVGMTSTGFTIADPNDAGSLDITGFDSSAPGVISNFIAGKF
jgi:60 kDa SS-A/Ro ribonucleoprotein